MMIDILFTVIGLLLIVTLKFFLVRLGFITSSLVKIVGFCSRHVWVSFDSIFHYFSFPLLIVSFLVLYLFSSTMFTFLCFCWCLFFLSDLSSSRLPFCSGNVLEAVQVIYITYIDFLCFDYISSWMILFKIKELKKNVYRNAFPIKKKTQHILWNLKKLNMWRLFFGLK